MSLLELLKQAYSEHKNYQGENFIPFNVARQILTVDRVYEWSNDHALCPEHGLDCSSKSWIIARVLEASVYTFVVLLFANLELLTKQLMLSGWVDTYLFDTSSFDKGCEAATLSKDQIELIVEYRRYVGVIFASSGYQDIPKDAILPFLKRENSDRYGSFGAIYLIEIAGAHISEYNENVCQVASLLSGCSMHAAKYLKINIAEKRVRPMTDPTQSDREKMSREIETLLRRKGHQNIVPLLASYTRETDESGHYVKTLHMLFPWAETDLAKWMTLPRTPPKVKQLSKEERDMCLYRFIRSLVAGVSYLHSDIEGTVTAHHDIKPHNILIINGLLKIGDLGHSHLRPVMEGSATEGISGLGTYDYQPPEYWDENGTRTQQKHGRAFDVWSVACIIVELMILVVHGWESKKITEFKSERRKNIAKDRKTPSSVGDGFDSSFHNNQVVIKQWIHRLRSNSNTQRAKGVLDVTAKMLVPKVTERPYMWEVELDLHKILGMFDEENVHRLEKRLFVRPPLRYDVGVSIDKALDPLRSKETPLHRAARGIDVKRIIRLWELGWPLDLPNRDGMTPLEIMSRNEKSMIRDLEAGVGQMLMAALIGDIGKLRMLFEQGFSPLMIDANGKSPLQQAIISDWMKPTDRMETIKYLLESRRKEQLMLRLGRYRDKLPLHEAASIGFYEFLESVLDEYPDLDTPITGTAVGRGKTALHLAAQSSHRRTVRLLLRNGAQVFPRQLHDVAMATPLHDVVDPDILKLLLEADKDPIYLNFQDLTPGSRLMPPPLLAQVFRKNFECFQVLIDHGAPIDTFCELNSYTALHIIAECGYQEFLQRCIEKFPLEMLEDLDVFQKGETPLQLAERYGHKEVARLLKARIQQLRGLAPEPAQVQHLSSSAGEFSTLTIQLARPATF